MRLVASAVGVSPGDSPSRVLSNTRGYWTLEIKYDILSVDSSCPRHG